MADAPFEAPDFLQPATPAPSAGTKSYLPAGYKLLVGPDGKVVPFDPLAAEGALGQFRDYSGFVPASPQQVEDWNRERAFQEKYGDLAGGLKAAGLAAARAILPGVSDMAAIDLGMDPEDIRNYRTENPIASGIGTAVGIAVPALLTGGASAAAEAPGVAAGLASATAPGMIAGAGRAATAAVREALGADIASSAIGRITAKALAAGAGSAIEGAAYGAGHVVSEKALGNPDLTAESALAQVGAGAALGFALGAGGSAIWNMGSEVFGSEAERLAKAASLHGRADAIREAAAGGAEEPASLTSGMGTGAIAGGLFGALTGGRGVEDLAGEAAGKLIHHVAGAAGLGMLAGPALALAKSPAFKARIADLAANALEGGLAGAGDVAATIGRGAIVAGATAAADSQRADALPGSRAPSEDEAIGALVDKTAAGVSADRQGGGMPDVTAQTIGDAPARVAVLAHLERNNQAVSNAIDDAARAAVGDSAPGPATIPTLSPDAYQRHANQLRVLSGNPEGLFGVLESQTRGWGHHAPETSQAMNIATARMASYLASKLPPPGPVDENGQPGLPSAAEIASFGRVLDAVNDPVGVLRQVRDATLTPEAAEAVQVVYPALFGRMQQALFAALADRGGRPVPYARRLAVNALLGRDDPTTSPLMFMAVQSAYAQNPSPAAMPPPTAPHGSRAGASKITLGKRSLTDMQSAASRSDLRKA